MNLKKSSGQEWIGYEKHLRKSEKILIEKHLDEEEEERAATARVWAKRMEKRRRHFRTSPPAFEWAIGSVRTDVPKAEFSN